MEQKSTKISIDDLTEDQFMKIKDFIELNMVIFNYYSESYPVEVLNKNDLIKPRQRERLDEQFNLGYSYRCGGECDTLIDEDAPISTPFDHVIESHPEVIQ